MGALAVLAVLAASGCAAKSDENQRGPLPGVMEFGLTEEEYNQHIERTQTLIAECMAEAGFEYIPVDVESIAAGQALMRTTAGYARRAFKEKWGLAVTTRFDHPVRDTGLGPNLGIWKALPASEQLAYSHALWGDNPDADFTFTFDEEDFSDTDGCTRKAVAQVFTRSQLKGTYVNPKDVLIDSDPRIVEAHKHWSECMHDRGYEYEYDQDEIIEEYGERFDELVEDDDPTSLTGARLQALHKLQQQEIAVALADFDCQADWTVEIYKEVEIEVFGHVVSG